MFKRFALIGVLCVGLAGLWAGGADAYPLSLAGYKFSFGSVDATTIWTGVANYELKPSFVAISLSDIQVRLYSINPGGNTGGVGVPFELSSPVVGTDVLNPVSKNGKYTSLIVFEDNTFTAMVDPALLPNPNWSFDPNHCDVVHFKAVIQGFTDIDNRCENYYIGSTVVNASCYPFDPAAQTRYAEEVVHAEVDCTLQNGVYVCTDLVPSWEWSKKSPYYIAP